MCRGRSRTTRRAAWSDAGTCAHRRSRSSRTLKTALKAAGSDLGHLVRLNSYLTDMSQLPAYREIRREYLGDSPHPSASTLVGVARLVEPEALLEVEAVAVAGDAPTRAEAADPVVVLADLTARPGKESELRTELLSRAPHRARSPGASSTTSISRARTPRGS